MLPDNPHYLHPYIVSKLDFITESIEHALNGSINCKIISGYIPAHKQFELYKQGREFKKGKWRITDTKKILTDKDGYILKSAHNYLPSPAMFVGLFDKENRYICTQHQYIALFSATDLKLEWQTDTRFLNRQLHLEMSKDDFFQHEIEKDNAMLWQELLHEAGTYFGEIDGIFGHKSTTALVNATGENQRNLIAWDMLYPLGSNVFLRSA